MTLIMVKRSFIENVTWLDSVSIKISCAINRFSVIIFYNSIKIIISAAIGKYFYGHWHYGVSSNDQIIAIPSIKTLNVYRKWDSADDIWRIVLRIKRHSCRYVKFTHAADRIESCYVLSYIHIQIYQIIIKKVELKLFKGYLIFFIGVCTNRVSCVTIIRITKTQISGPAGLKKTQVFKWKIIKFKICN